ncbi:DUF3540 domain-containing protein, partial [Nostoc sp. NIES-2111]
MNSPSMTIQPVQQTQRAVGMLECDVIRSDRDRIDVTIAGVTVTATRAFSCLVDPLPGDTVVAADTGAEVIVLAILRRPGLGDATLTLADPAARLRLEAQAITLAATTAVAVEAPEIRLDAARLSLLGRVTHWLGKTLALVGEKLTNSGAT